jgi:hypothetical protein
MWINSLTFINITTVLLLTLQHLLLLHTSMSIYMQSYNTESEHFTFYQQDFRFNGDLACEWNETLKNIKIHFNTETEPRNFEM